MTPLCYILTVWLFIILFTTYIFKPWNNEPEPNFYEVEVTDKKLKSWDMNSIPAELMKADGRTLHPEIHKF
jgi:hypothetical protein